MIYINVIYIYICVFFISICVYTDISTLTWVHLPLLICPYMCSGLVTWDWVSSVVLVSEGV